MGVNQLFPRDPEGSGSGGSGQQEEKEGPTRERPMRGAVGSGVNPFPVGILLPPPFSDVAICPSENEKSGIFL